MTGWQAYLNPGERVLWQGRPDSRFQWSATRSPKDYVAGVMIVAFSLFWAISAAMAGVPVWPAGLIFTVLGIRLMGGDQFWHHYIRQRSTYSLTDQRAFIASAPFGRRRLRTVDLAPITRFSWDGAHPGTIMMHRGTRDPGRALFEMLSDPAPVLRLLQDRSEPLHGREQRL